MLIPCADDLACINLVCEARHKSGEGCFLTSDCEEGLDCKPCFVDGCDHPFQCFPQTGHQLFDRDLCLSLYSAGIHQEAKSQNLTRSFGAGTVVTVVAGASDEVGTVYGQNGSYGCYLTTCVGAQSDVGIADFVSLGFFESYADFRGTSVAVVEEVGEGLVFSTAQIFTPGFGRLVGTADCMAVSVSLAPISAGLYECNTVVDTVIGNKPPASRCGGGTVCADALSCTAEASIDAGSSDPDGDPITTSQVPTGPYGIGTRTVTLTVTDQAGESDTCSAQLRVNDCTEPVMICPAPAIAECTGSESAFVDPGDASVTDCSQVAVTDPGAASYPVGTTQAVYTATDAFNNVSACATTVTVVDTQPPALTCPPPTNAECTGSGGAVVDPGDASAVDGCSSVSVDDPGPAMYPLGTTQVAYVAKDHADNSSECSTTVIVVDTQAPAITGVSANPNLLWPPDHRMQAISVGIAAVDTCVAPVSCEVVHVTSNEPQSGLAGGRDVAGDMQITGRNTVSLRAERDGSGSGRIYTITVECRDHTGVNTTQETVDVIVPHDGSVP